MSVNNDSVLDLLGKLCNLHLGQTKRSHLIQPKTERDVHFHHLRRKAFDTLFTYLKSPDSKRGCVGEGGGVRVEVDRVLLLVYQCRTDRRFHDADRMELLLQQLLEDWTEDKGRVLQLLTALADSGQPPTPPPLGHCTYHTPIITQPTGEAEVVTLPGGPLNYGDSQSVTGVAAASAQWPYTLYPPKLFSALAISTIPSSRLCNHGALPASVFTMLPGTGTEISHLLSTEKNWLDSHGQLSRLSLFGGLLQPRDLPITVTLQLPDLPDDPYACPPEITIPKALSMSELSEDEGFVTTEGSSAATTPCDSGVEEDIWDLALSSTPCRNYVWERIGCEPMVTEKPYLTEAGPQVVDELCHLLRQHEHLLQPSTTTTTTTAASPIRQLSPAQLCKDVIYLLIGVPSRTFVYLQEEGEFRLAQGVSTHGLSPEALSSLLGDLVTCGTHYQRLATFSAPQQAHIQEELPSAYTQGLVLQAFKAGVRAVLQHYRATVLSLPRSMSLLALHVHCGKSVMQIQFLAELCHCSTSPDHAPDTAFPLGVALISYLYQETLNAVNTDNYLLMLSLLQHTCQPFVMFVQEWVFHGTFRDVYGEFMIQMNHKFLEARDETYWEQGFTMNQEEGVCSVPSFLTSLASDIFRCGKALNLLRMCCPSHFVCGVSDSDIPQLSIVYSGSHLRQLGRQCDMYISRLQQMARQLSTSRAQQQQRVKEAQRELLETARRMAAQEIARLQGILDARRQRADVKKREEFQRLKEQMTVDLQRRAGEVAEARKEDAEYMARLTHSEEVMTEREIQLETQARDELIAYYTELGEEAALRERRALWRIRRAQLETRRNLMLEADAERWRAEMDEHSHAQRLLERGSDAENPLPEWAQQGESGKTTHTLQVPGADPATTSSSKDDHDWSLPKWVELSSVPGTGQQHPVSKHPVEGGTEQQVQVPVSLQPAGSGIKQQDLQSSASFETSRSETSTAVRTDSFVSAKSQCSAAMTTDSFITVKSEPSSTGSGDTGRGVAAVKKEGFVLGLGLEKDEAEVKTDRGETGGGETERSSGTDREKDKMAATDRVTERGADRETAKSSEVGSLSHRGEDRMPAWARRVLHQGVDSSIDTVVIADNNNDKAADSVVIAANNSDEATSNPVSARSQASDIEEKNSDDTALERGVSGGGGVGLASGSGGRSGIHMVEGRTSQQETEQGKARSHIQMSSSVGASTESCAPEDAPFHIRLVAGMSATTETTESWDEHAKTTITFSKTMHATKETQEVEQRPHLRMNADRNATVESSQEIQSIPRLGGSGNFNVSVETTGEEWRAKKASLFGHVSQLSKEDYSFQAPRLKRQRHLHPSVESEMREFAVRPHIRTNRLRAVNEETEEKEARPGIRTLKGRHVSMESDYVDVQRLRRQRFLQQNVFGHSSDSSVQRLLYGAGFGSIIGLEDIEEEGELKELVPRFDLSALDLMPDLMEPLPDQFDYLSDRAAVDLLASLPGVVHGGVGAAPWQGELTQEEADLITLTPLPILMQQALTAPLSSQVRLVDQTVVNYFLVDQSLDSHLQALHRYLFMADGDFAQNVTDILLEKMSTCRLPQEMLTPVFLNGALNRALQLSDSTAQHHADRLSFFLRYTPHVFKHTSHDALDCLELRYKVDWPLNVVLTESCQKSYGQVFSFMLKLKRVAWSLNQCWHRLKRDAIVKKAKDSHQFRQLQLHRQEQQHFVRVMEGYMCSQIIQLTWSELQGALDTEVKSLDDLRTVHYNYLHRALFRCLLNTKAAPIMKIILNIFSLILKFCALLNSATWEQNPTTGEVTHPNFGAMVAAYKGFKKYFVFLFEVVTKLAVRGYQPHLHELLLRLNFNDYYTLQ